MNTLKELLATISGDGHASLDEDQRQRLIAELEACFVDEGHLERYLHVLQDVLGGEPWYTDEGFLSNEDQFDAVCEDGLGVLDNESLVHTALNPGVLWAMNDLFCDVDFLCDESFTKHWSAVCAKIGRELL